MKLPPKKDELLLCKYPRRTNWHELCKYSLILDHKNSMKGIKIQRMRKGISRENKKNKSKSASDGGNKMNREKTNQSMVQDRIDHSKINYP